MSLSGTSRSPSGTHPVKRLPPAPSGWTGRPAQAESRPSTGCPRATAPSGWTGRPAQAESRPSTGCRKVNQLACNPLSARTSSVRLDRPPSSGGISPVNSLVFRQVGQAAQLRRNLARQPVAVEKQLVSGWTGRPAQAESRPSTGCPRATAPVRLDRPPSSGGISPVNWLLLRATARQVGQAAQLRRNLARQLVVSRDSTSGWTGGPAQAESRPSTGWTRATDASGWRGSPTGSVNWLEAISSHVRVGQAAQLRRNLARQLVVVKTQLRQVGQAAQLRRYPPV